ncbi:hypothetical protein OsJ_03060 [Oryza sativa Japonica Group]|uniref:L-gulonolactone oxidase n=1 Tax=Oryza sativa subsp. japonica TaxID=39947 RepID=B9EYP4_ORYSJ|nr:hypothetical protein OsJ_03060 [Oryza sativa Japonica Group]
MVPTFSLPLQISTLLPAAVPLPRGPPVRFGGSGGPGGDGAGCVLSNAYGAWSSDRADCPVSAVAYPASEADVVAVVADASAKNMPVKVVSGFAHTIPKLACPGNGSSGAASSLLISTASTGSHGSSWWGRGGAVHDHVVALRLVVPAGAADGWAKVVALRRGDALFNAALVSLGLLGVISKVTLALEPRFKRSISYEYRDDFTFQDDFESQAANHEFAEITWYPSQHKAVYRIDDRMPLNATGDGGPRDRAEASRNVKGKCKMAAAEIAAKRLVGNGLRGAGGRLFTGYPVVGFQGRMQTSGSCARSPPTDTLSACPWDPRYKGLFFYESTAMFSPAARFRDFVLDVKRLRDVDPDSMCGVDAYNGLLVRFVKASEAYLGQPEDTVVVDFNYYRASDGSSPRLSQDVWEEGRMQTSGSCARSPPTDTLSACPWDPRYKGLFFYESTAMFSPAARFRDFVLDVKRLRDVDPDSMCGVDAYNGLLVRFVKASEAYLGQPEDTVVVDFNYYRASDGSSPRLSQDVWEEVEQLAFVKHGARPHWAKNRLRRSGACGASTRAGTSSARRSGSSTRGGCSTAGGPTRSSAGRSSCPRPTAARWRAAASAPRTGTAARARGTTADRGSFIQRPGSAGTPFRN